VAQGRPYETPNVLSESLGDKIAKYVRMGDRPFVAAELCGVPRRTHYEWIEKGEADKLDSLDTIYSRYAHKIEAAESYAEHARVIIIAAAARSRVEAAAGEGQVRVPGDWRAALEWLRRRRDGWQDRKEITGKDGSPLFGASGFEGMNDDEIEERLSGLRERERTARRDRRATATPRARSKAGTG